MLKNDRERRTHHANAGDVPDVQATGTRGVGRVPAVRRRDGQHAVPVDAGKAVPPRENIERDCRVRGTVCAGRHTAVPKRRPVQLRGHEDHAARTVRHVQWSAVHHTEAVRVVDVPEERIQPSGQIHASRRKEHTGR